MIARMSKLMLRLRELSTGAPRTQEFESMDQAATWLKARPQGVEVLGVVFEGLTREENDRLRASMRPLDHSEEEQVRAHDAKEAAEREKKAEARRLEAAKDAEGLKAAAKNASPNRTMEIVYRFDEPELRKTDVNDDRPIPDEAKAAVMEWVHERMEWVAGRGQTVGEAKVTLYPFEVPSGKDRITVGVFVPVTAAPKNG